MKRACVFDEPDTKRIVRLNIGGQKIDTTKATLRGIPFFDPYLESRFDMATDDEGRIFVDRCGILFTTILQFIRSGRRPSQKTLQVQREALEDECEFFLVESLIPHLREETSPYDLRSEDRGLRNDETSARDCDDGPGDDVLLDFFREDCSPLDRQNLQLHALFTNKLRATSTQSFDVFFQRLDKFSFGLLRELVAPDIVIAGGAVARALFVNYVSGYSNIPDHRSRFHSSRAKVGALVGAPSSDLDIFLTCPPCAADGRLKDVYAAVQKVVRAQYGGRGKLLVTRSVNAITFHLCLGTKQVAPPVQVVLCLGRTVADVLTRFDVDCCAVGYVPGTRTVLSTRRAMRAMRHAANVVDSALGSESYVRRLYKYANRGFCVAVPGYAPDRVSSDLLSGSYAYFAHSGLLLREGRYLPLSDVPRAIGIQPAGVRAGTAVNHLAKLVVLDHGRPLVAYHDEVWNPGRRATAPFRTGLTGEYVIVTGCVEPNSVPIAVEEEKESDLYVVFSALIPGIIEKAYRVEEKSQDPPTPDGWLAGGLARRAAGNGAVFVTGDDARGGDIVVAYDMVTCDAALEGLRYVFDARQPPFSDLEADAFEEQFAFPPTVRWVRGGWARKSVRGFTEGVYS